jgi:PAS domain-containing protein
MAGQPARSSQPERDEVERLASFPELNPNPVIEMRSDGAVTYANPATRRLLPDLDFLGSNHPLLAGVPNLKARLRYGPDDVVIEDVPVIGTNLADTLAPESRDDLPAHARLAAVRDSRGGGRAKGVRVGEQGRKDGARRLLAWWCRVAGRDPVTSKRESWPRLLT